MMAYEGDTKGASIRCNEVHRGAWDLAGRAKATLCSWSSATHRCRQQGALNGGQTVERERGDVEDCERSAASSQYRNMEKERMWARGEEK